MVKLIAGVNDFETWCKENNREDLLKEWDYEKNTILPSEILPGSHIKVWWKCNKGHKWEAKIVNRTIHGTNCPYCLNKKVLKGFNDLESQKPELLIEWDYDNNIQKPDEVMFTSRLKYNWICKKCGRNFSQSLYNRVKIKTGCPYCNKNHYTKYSKI